MNLSFVWETQIHPKAHEAALEARASPELSDRLQQLERDVARHRDEAAKAQAEVDRLLEILKEMENEKNDKDKKIAELESPFRQVGIICREREKIACLAHGEKISP
ncbi:hypothetical protein DUI87_19868 [Hirundo rustica rustica]|uniref:Uncharacterized protein n=1 Tax=Hirundo rustica rustica TaxID=333673 RepID=A0A3M0JVA6_HIRRU|nr:hypothetical protein DUI87_19868 [Hirundo rustica rustica]